MKEIMINSWSYMSRGYLIYAEGDNYIFKAKSLKESIEYQTEDEVTICSGYLKRFGGDASYGKKHKIHKLGNVISDKKHIGQNCRNQCQIHRTQANVTRG